MNRVARIRFALVLLLVLHAAILSAAFLAPYPYAEQHRDFPFAPPTRIHFAGIRPVVFGLKPGPAGNNYQEDRSAAYPIHLGFHGHLFGVEPPATLFLCGTDGLGRDVFSRLLYGGQVSLLTGLVAAAISLSLGLLLGMAAGYFGGWPDQVLMRSGELVMAVPWFYLLLAVRAFMPLHIGPLQAFLVLVAIIGGIGWVRPARLVRGVALAGKEQPFVLAARGFGASFFYIIRRHLAPLSRPILVTQATVLIPQYILAEVALSFLGLGITEPVPSWGTMLAEARQYHVIVGHIWLLAPGCAAVPVLLAYLMLADALLDYH